MRRNTISITMAAGMVALVTAAGCAKREPTAPRDLAPGREPVAVQREQVVTAMATVEDVDQETRMVTLRAEDGHKFIFRAGEEVRNLPQVRKGHLVVVKYYEGLAAEVRTPTEEERANPRAIVEAAGRAPVGSMPAAAGARSVRVLATITGINKATEHITLRGPEGESTTVRVRDPRNLDKVQVGDPVIITYTEAVGISVEPAPASAASKKAEAPRKKKK